MSSKEAFSQELSWPEIPMIMDDPQIVNINHRHQLMCDLCENNLFSLGLNILIRMYENYCISSTVLVH